MLSVPLAIAATWITEVPKEVIIVELQNMKDLQFGLEKKTERKCYCAEGKKGHLCPEVVV